MLAATGDIFPVHTSSFYTEDFGVPFSSLTCGASGPVTADLMLTGNTSGFVDPGGSSPQLDFSSGSLAMTAKVKFSNAGFPGGECLTDEFEIRAAGELTHANCNIMDLGPAEFCLWGEAEVPEFGVDDCGGCGTDLNTYFDLGTPQASLYMHGEATDFNGNPITP